MIPFLLLAAFGQQQWIGDKCEASALMCCSQGFPDHVPSFRSSLKPLPVGSSRAAYTIAFLKEKLSSSAHTLAHTHKSHAQTRCFWGSQQLTYSTSKLRFTPLTVCGWFVPHFDLVFCCCLSAGPHRVCCLLLSTATPSPACEGKCLRVVTLENTRPRCCCFRLVGVQISDVWCCTLCVPGMAL